MIEEIIETGSRGKELLKDAFIIGLAWGRQILIEKNDLQLAINQLQSFNNNIDKSLESPFSKDDKFNEFLKNNNFQLFNIPRLSNQQPYQITTPQKKLQEDQQPLNNLQNQSPFQINVSPQKGKEVQSQNICQLCNFYFDTKSKNQKAILSSCQHQFHFLCLYIHTQEKGEYCPICAQQLEEAYPKSLYEDLPQTYKSCCPNIKCQNDFVYFGQEYFFCNMCNLVWCLKCKKNFHENSNCIIDIDHYKMSLGQKYKFCFQCNKVLFLNNLPTDDNYILPKHC
ncbi:unnamed protein product [Paramecium pentaurelia]|uniref:RING-type domain-containing protein n=1 Tax=Paramecium pentaurelia TaxID=43138 RepID=A0A8S1XUT8_9CILI|nr:unnamed protein product [Paramecium pentaurelia]